MRNAPSNIRLIVISYITATDGYLMMMVTMDAEHLDDHLLSFLKLLYLKKKGEYCYSPLVVLGSPPRAGEENSLSQAR